MLSCVNFNVQLTTLVFIMNLILIIFLLSSFQVFSSDFDGCKQIGEKAKRIMELRQTKNDLNELLEMFDQDVEIVLDAFSKDHVDTLVQLSIQIDSYGSLSFDDETRKYNEMESRQENIIKAFKVSYILKCMKKQNPSK